MHFHPLLATLLVLPFTLAAPTASPNSLTLPVRVISDNSGDIVRRDYDNDQTFREGMLAAHNSLRGQHSSETVSWDDGLANAAAKVTAKCVFEHSGGPYGENLAVGYTNSKDTCSAWGEVERKNYDYNNPGFNKNTGHFTQMVWANTKKIGCARTKCDKLGWLVACEYQPAGNVMGGNNFRENVKQPK